MSDTNSRNLANDTINKELIDDAAKHGLYFRIYQDELPHSPRDGADTTWINVDEPIPQNVDKGMSIAMFFKNYCRDILKCDINDVEWFAVKKYGSSRVAYEMKSRDVLGSVDGVIFMTHDAIKRVYEVDIIDDATKLLIQNQMMGEIQDYQDAYNGEVYTTDLCTLDGEVIDYIACVIGLDEVETNKYASELLETAIGSHFGDNNKSLIDVTLVLNSDLWAESKSPFTYISQIVSKSLGTAFLINGTQIDTESNEVTFTLDYGILDSFKQLDAHCGDNLIKLVVKKYHELNGIEMSREAESSMVMQIIELDDYSNWEQGLLQALINTLVEQAAVKQDRIKKLRITA